MVDYQRHINIAQLWSTIKSEARQDAQQYAQLAGLLERTLLQADSFAEALANILAHQLVMPPDMQQVTAWQGAIGAIYKAKPQLITAAEADLLCQLQSNAAIKDHYTPLLYFGGFHALQCYRLAHDYWQQGELPMANYIQARMVEKFGVDIHPAAQLGKGIFMDHAEGIVIGETARVEDRVTLFQGVTLGGTGKGSGDRHPKIRQGAFIGCGAQILGNIEIGAGAKVGAGAIVVQPVAAGTTVLGTAAKVLNNLSFG